MCILLTVSVVVVQVGKMDGVVREVKIGDKVLVPRTGGGVSPGEVIELWGDLARVQFRVGDLYRGKPAPEQFRDAMGHKTLKITELKPIEED
jgi:hypothetical protein